MCFAEILEEISRLTFTERQELVRRAVALDDAELTAEENALLDERMEDFRRKDAPQSGKEDWDFVLSRVPARPPLPGDEMPR